MGKYESLKVSELQDIARSKGLSGWSELKERSKLISLIMDSEGYPTKYFSFLSVLTARELHDLAQEGRIYDHWSLNRANLMRLMDDRCVNRRYIIQRDFKKCVRRWMFPVSLRAWVGLFVSDESTAEHYVQIILHVLSPMICLERKKPVRRLSKRPKEYISIINEMERREEIFSKYLRLGK